MDCIQAENIMNISDGTFNLKSYGGAPATVSSNNSSTTDSCKGVKAGSLVNISGGTFNIKHMMTAYIQITQFVYRAVI